MSPKRAFLSKQSRCSRYLCFGDAPLGTSFLLVGPTLGNTSVTVDVVISEYVCTIETGSWYLKFACMFGCFSCIRLFVTPRTVARQAPISMRFSRQEYWSELPCPPPGNLHDPGIEPRSPASPALQAHSLLLSHQGSPFQVSLVNRFGPFIHRVIFLNGDCGSIGGGNRNQKCPWWPPTLNEGWQRDRFAFCFRRNTALGQWAGLLDLCLQPHFRAKLEGQSSLEESNNPMTFPSLHSAVIFATEELSTVNPIEGNICYVGSLWAHSPAAPGGLYLVQKRCRRHKGWGCLALKQGGPLNKASLNGCLFHGS